jgi:toxin ParE1/3/4
LPKCEFSRLALADLKAISRYTIQEWGAEQAIRYMDAIQECIRELAKSPLMGRACDKVETGYRRMEHGRHVIFYRRKEDGIFLGRVLHQRMLPRRHVVES